MKFFLISDNSDTQMGMRLAGIEGIIASNYQEAIQALDNACLDEDIAVVLMTTKIMNLCKDKAMNLKLTLKKPLIVEIPDRHGNSDISRSINSYVSEAIGLKL